MTAEALRETPTNVRCYRENFSSLDEFPAPEGTKHAVVRSTARESVPPIACQELPMGMITVEDAMFAQTPNGEIVPGAHLYVYHHGADTLARIFSDSSMIEMQANPMTADEFGQFDKCYTSDGIYRLVMTSPSGASLAIFENVEVQSNESSALTVAQRWASEAEDTVVANGYFSALHYAAKAADAEAATR